ncbi:hypothetical protein J6590_008285 [Homalodisca vitripennis]|nr:hypothetical protein J6590_008285 [Homalodisca vitripennis]
MELGDDQLPVISRPTTSVSSMSRCLYLVLSSLLSPHVIYSEAVVSTSNDVVKGDSITSLSPHDICHMTPTLAPRHLSHLCPAVCILCSHHFSHLMEIASPLSRPTISVTCMSRCLYLVLSSLLSPHVIYSEAVVSISNEVVKGDSIASLSPHDICLIYVPLSVSCALITSLTWCHCYTNGGHYPLL